MAVTTPLGTVPLTQMINKKPHNNPNTITNTSVNLRHFVGHKRFFVNQWRSSNLSCHCATISRNDDTDNDSGNDNNNSNHSNGSVSNEWDWNRWTRHFSEIEQAESFSSVLKFQLMEAVEKEDFREAAKLKSAIAEATSKDTVAEIMSELKKAIDEERYLDASKLSRNTGGGLVGWWIGSAKDSEDPFGRLVRITPGVGKFIGRSYTPRQLVTASPGTTLFEIYVVKDADGTYAMQVVYLQRSKGATSSASLQPKPTRDSPKTESEDPSVVDVKSKKDIAEKQEEKILNIEGATEEGIKSVINFLKDKIPGLNVKVMNITVGEEVIDSDSLKRFTQGDSEEEDEDEDDEVDSSDEDESETDTLTMEGNSDSLEDDNDFDMKVFVGGIVHNEDDVPSKGEIIRLPGQIKDAEKDSFLLHIPGIRGTEESKTSNSKLSAVAAAQSISDLMPSDVAKAFLGSDKLSPKASRNVRDILKYAVNQAQRKSKLSEYTRFDRIKIPRGKFDPFDGLYVGAFGPYGTEIVQLRRKFGHWNTGNELDESSDVEFFEYVEAVKLTGDLNVPAGQVTFRAKIGKGSRLSSRTMYPDELGVVASYKGQGRIAEYGFKNPKWVEGELLQLNGKGIGPYVKGADLGFLYVVPEQSFLVIFNRLNLPE